VDGVAAIAMSATHATQIRKATGCLTDSLAVNLDPDPLALAAHRLAEIVHLGANDIVDRFLRAVDIIANRLADVVDRNRVDHLLGSLATGAITAG
jgi:hypothetical protein